MGQGGGQGGVDWGGHQRAVWEQQGIHWSDLAGEEGGRRGGCGPGRRARMGGGTREQCGSNKGVHWFHFFGSLQNLTIGLIWLVTRGGGVGSVGQGGGQKGGVDGGGHQRAVWEKAFTG